MSFMNGLKEFMNITLSNLICVACLNTNRRFIGIELDKTYFNIAKERIYATARDTEKCIRSATIIQTKRGDYGIWCGYHSNKHYIE